MTMHNFCYPSAFIGDRAGLKWQRKMAITYAHLEIMFGSYTNINYGVNITWCYLPESVAFVLSPITHSALSWLVKKEIS